MKRGKSLKFNIDINKRKCYQCMNGIIGKIGNKAELVIPLCEAFCFPILLYGIEPMNLNKTEQECLNSTMRRLLFKCNDSLVIKSCQYYMSCMPIDYVIDLQVAKFYPNLAVSNNCTLHYMLKVPLELK